MKKITLLSTVALVFALSACCQCKNCKVEPVKASTIAIEPVLVTPPAQRVADDAVVEETPQTDWLSPAWAKWALAGSLIGVGVGVHFLLRNNKK